MNIGLAVDAMVLTRLVLARIFKETGNGWMYYLGLAASTIIWVPMIVGD